MSKKLDAISIYVDGSEYSYLYKDGMFEASFDGFASSIPTDVLKLFLWFAKKVGPLIERWMNNG